VVQKVTKLLVKLVKHNPDVSGTLCIVASLVLRLMMCGSGSVSVGVFYMIIVKFAQVLLIFS